MKHTFYEQLSLSPDEDDAPVEEEIKQLSTEDPAEERAAVEILNFKSEYDRCLEEFGEDLGHIKYRHWMRSRRRHNTDFEQWFSAEQEKSRRRMEDAGVSGSGGAGSVFSEDGEDGLADGEAGQVYGGEYSVQNVSSTESTAKDSGSTTLNIQTDVSAAGRLISLVRRHVGILSYVVLSAVVLTLSVQMVESQIALAAIGGTILYCGFIVAYYSGLLASNTAFQYFISYVVKIGIVTIVVGGILFYFIQ